MIIILTAAQISNAWEAIRTTTNIVDVSQTIPITNLLFTNFPTALLIVGVIITLGLFLKGRGTGGV